MGLDSWKAWKVPLEVLSFSFLFAMPTSVLAGQYGSQKTAIKVTGKLPAQGAWQAGKGLTLGTQWRCAAPVMNAAVVSDRPEEGNFPSPSEG